MKSFKNQIIVTVVTIATSSAALAQMQPPGLRPGQPMPPRPGQPTPPPAPPQPPPKLMVDQRMLESVASRAGHVYAQEVLDKVGELYNVRINLIRGLNRAASMLGNHDNISEIRSRSSEYSMAYQNGLIEGDIQGRQAGDTAAQESARQLADADITQLIDKALDMGLGTNIKFTMNPRVSPFNGLNSPLSVPSRLFSSRFVDERSSVQNSIERILSGSISSYSSLFRDAFDVNELVRRDEYEIPALPFEFRGPNVIRNFHQESLSTRRIELDEARRYYRDIGTNQYATPAQNQEMFNRTFMHSYARTLEFGNTWSQRINSYNPNATSLGERLYTDIAAGIARETGRADAFAVKFTAASIEGFRSANKDFKAYKSQFAGIVDRVMNSSYISEVDAMIVPEDGSKTEFTVGDTFNVIVKKVSNRGMKDGKITADVATEGNVKSMNQAVEITVPAMTRVNVPSQFVRLGWISDITAADEDVVVTAVVDGKRFSTTFKVTLNETLKKISLNAEPALSDWMMGRMASLLKAEYAQYRGYKNFKNRDQKLTLVRMKNFFDQLSEADKNNIRRHGQIIRDAYGPQEIGISGDDWEATQKIMNEMGLAGKSPVDNTPPVPNW